MIAITDFLPRLLPHVTGCSDPMAIQALVDSAISFCEDSLVIRQRLDPQRTRMGGVEFDIDAPTDQAVSRIMKVWVQGREIRAIPSDMVNDAMPLMGQPTAFYTLQDSGTTTAMLHPVPDAVYTLAVEVALRPTRNATRFNDDLFNTWMEHVVTGAMARLMSTQDQPFTNLALGQNAFAKALYMSRRARVEGSYGRVRATVTVQQRPFA